MTSAISAPCWLTFPLSTFFRPFSVGLETLSTSSGLLVSIQIPSILQVAATFHPLRAYRRSDNLARDLEACATWSRLGGPTGTLCPSSIWYLEEEWGSALGVGFQEIQFLCSSLAFLPINREFSLAGIRPYIVGSALDLANVYL